MELRIVTWNLKGLARDSNPDRLQRAQQAFQILAKDDKTAIFALVELGPDSILEHLANALGHPWEHCSGAIGGLGSNIGLLVNTALLSATTFTVTTEPHYSTGKDIGMRRQTAAVYWINIEQQPCFLLAVVHFKADGGGAESYTRKAQAIWLRNELEQALAPVRLPVVIVGDFNGEPYEPMFGEEGIRAYRRADVMRRCQDSLKLYNPMWKLLSEPLTVSERHAIGPDQASTPYGTFLGKIWHSLIDGVIVSSEWMEGQGYRLLDHSLEILTDDLWYHVGPQGGHNARPAGMAETKAADLAITDHLPVAVNLEVS